ncbi:MAG: response regulator [Anaerolineae bacterium]
MTDRIRILLADDHALLRAGMRALLDGEPDMVVVGEAGDGAECVELAQQIKPDVIILDINMPRCNGLEALGELRELVPASRVLVLTMHDDAGYLRRVLASGGVGYVLKQAASDELLSAIRAVREGGTYLHPEHTKLLLESAPGAEPASRRPKRPNESRYELLSEREAQVFELLALGYRNGEIAELLNLSVKTVETYKARLMQKLELRSRAALVRYALDLGILSSGDDKAGRH